VSAATVAKRRALKAVTQQPMNYLHVKKMYERYSESKDTSPVQMQGIFSSEMAVLPCEIGTV
jgi:hypothetical protein